MLTAASWWRFGGKSGFVARGGVLIICVVWSKRWVVGRWLAGGLLMVGMLRVRLIDRYGRKKRGLELLEVFYIAFFVSLMRCGSQDCSDWRFWVSE